MGTLIYAELMHNVGVIYVELVRSMLEQIATKNVTSDIKEQLSALGTPVINLTLINMAQKKLQISMIKEAAAGSFISMMILVTSAPHGSSRGDELLTICILYMAVPQNAGKYACCKF